MRLADRLEHDERLEALLAQLHGRPGADVDADVMQDISNIARRRCTPHGSQLPENQSAVVSNACCADGIKASNYSSRKQEPGQMQ